MTSRCMAGSSGVRKAMGGNACSGRGVPATTKKGTCTKLSRRFSAKTTTMSTDAQPRPPLPDRLCTDLRSPHYNEAVLEHDIVIRFNGKDRTDVDEYCISEGWIK